MAGLVGIVARISQAVTTRLCEGGAVLRSLVVVAATATTPIVVTTDQPHQVQQWGANALIAGVGGIAAANGAMLVLPVDETHLQVLAIAADGSTSSTVGVGSYSGGGTLGIALTDGKILIGQAHIAERSAAPRIVFVPADSVFTAKDVAHGQIGSPNQRQQIVQRSILTDRIGFDVYVWGFALGAPLPPPEFHYEAAHTLYHQVIASTHQLMPGFWRATKGVWPGADPKQKQIDTYGVEYRFGLELDTPVLRQPKFFAPPGVAALPSSSIKLNPDDPGSAGCGLQETRMPTGDVQIQVIDNGGSMVSANPSKVQVVMGCAAAGSIGLPVACGSTKALSDYFVGGPLAQAGALTVLNGGLVIGVRLTANSAGVASAVTFVGSGTSVITVTGTPIDDYFVVFKVIKGGTIAAAGITFRVSVDAGRTFGPELALGAGSAYVVGDTGCTLHFAAGTLVATDVATFGCTAPQWADAGVQVALNALLASPYANTGWGSGHLVGGGSAGGGANQTDASTIQTYLNALATSKTFTHLIAGARDASPPAKWGGTGEAEATWQAAVITDFAAASDDRVAMNGGHYNMPSAFQNVAYGAPRMRRSLSYALAARIVALSAQRHAGRVKDGNISQIVVDAINDPQDGFIYHNELINPGFDAARLTSAWTRTGRSGLYFRGDNTLAQAGSDFALRPVRAVMDVGCGVLNFAGTEEIDDDVFLNDNGTIDTAEADAIEATIVNQYFNPQMVQAGLCKKVTVAIDRTANIRDTGKVPLHATIYRKGYILEVDATIQINNDAAASAA